MEDYAFPKCPTMKRITYKSKFISYDFEAAPSRGNWVYSLFSRWKGSTTECKINYVRPKQQIP